MKMIRLEDYVLKAADITDTTDLTFFKRMNQNKEFQKYFGTVSMQKEIENSIFMNDFIVIHEVEKIGYIHLSDKIEKDSICAVTLYYYIDPYYRNKGIATRLLGQLIYYLQNYEKINYIILNIHKENIPSIKVAIQNGFIKNLEDDEEMQFIRKPL